MKPTKAERQHEAALKFLRENNVEIDSRTDELYRQALKIAAGLGKKALSRPQKSMLRGHEIEKLKGEFVYADNKQPTAEAHKDRPCGKCDEHRTKEGHDACLGTLPGLMNACCGHGNDREAYVQFQDGSALQGKDAINVIKLLK